MGLLPIAVPLWGLFNLPRLPRVERKNTIHTIVSVPIRGLFNLTRNNNFTLQSEEYP